jgi:hypothetical protein
MVPLGLSRRDCSVARAIDEGDAVALGVGVRLRPLPPDGECRLPVLALLFPPNVRAETHDVHARGAREACERGKMRGGAYAARNRQVARHRRARERAPGEAAEAAAAGGSP